MTASKIEWTSASDVSKLLVIDVKDGVTLRFKIKDFAGGYALYWECKDEHMTDIVYDHGSNWFQSEQDAIDRLEKICKEIGSAFSCKVDIPLAKVNRGGRPSTPVVVITPTENIPFHGVREAAKAMGVKYKLMYEFLNSEDGRIEGTDNYIEYAVTV